MPTVVEPHEPNKCEWNEEKGSHSRAKQRASTEKNNNNNNKRERKNTQQILQVVGFAHHLLYSVYVLDRLYERDFLEQF